MTIEPLSGQPVENGELVFDAPWQARSFAMAVKLHEAGLFSWKDWSDKLSDNIAAFEQHGVIASSGDYYQLWQQTLEQMVQKHGG